MNGSSCVRDFDIDLINKTLSFHQKIEGDVSCVVWDAAIVLAKYLEEICRKKADFLKNLQVVELGSGLGCVGLTAACLGANVTLTDLPEALTLLQHNIDNNLTKIQGTVQAKALSWGNATNFEVIPDLILLADCIYYEESIEPLIKTLVDLTGPKTEIFMTQEMRDTPKQQKIWSKFLETVKKNFNLDYVPLEEQDPDYCSPDIVLIKMRKL